MVDHLRYLSRLGAQPTPFVVASITASILEFPWVLWRDRGEPLSSIVILSAFYGTVLALVLFVTSFLLRQATKPETEPAPAPLRRGAIVGLIAGVAWFGGFVAFCLTIGEWGDAIYFAVPLLVIVAQGILQLRKAKDRTRRTSVGELGPESVYRRA